MLVTGFPTLDQPANGIFNLRAAKMLSESVDINVVHLRAWKPGRRPFSSSVSDRLDLLTLAIPQIPNWETLNRAAYKLLGWPLLGRLVKTCDLIHSVDLGFSGILGSAWGRLGGIRHVTQITTDVERTRRQWKRSPIKWQRHVHGVACNSQAIRMQFANYFPRIPNVRRIYRGVDLSCYNPDGPVAGPLANKAPVRFLYLGGFPDYRGAGYGANTKGGETLLAAWRAAEKELIPAGASLLVAGPQVNRSQLSVWLGNLRDASAVHVIDRIHPDEVAAYIRASDVLLVPSMQEGLPNVLMEAAACGRAVLGSNTGGIPEIIANEETGLILPAGDGKAWKDALRIYATKFNVLRIMGRRARQRMELLFDSKAYLPNMLDLYAAALREPLRLSGNRSIQPVGQAKSMGPPIPIQS